MNRIKNKIIIIFIMVVYSLGMGIYGVRAERSWDNKTEEENVIWAQELESWDQAIKKWDKKRDDLHEQYYGDKYDDHAKYCDGAVCWEEKLFYLVFNPKDSSVMNLRKSDCGFKGDLIFQDNSTWECHNGGQSITYNGLDGEFWESRNNGQVIEYKNTAGDHWITHNRGQTIEFSGSDGEKWMSHNYGQGIDYTDKDGNTWSGSDDDNIDDMR